LPLPPTVPSSEFHHGLCNGSQLLVVASFTNQCWPGFLPRSSSRKGCWDTSCLNTRQREQCRTSPKDMTEVCVRSACPRPEVETLRCYHNEKALSQHRCKHIPWCKCLYLTMAMILPNISQSRPAAAACSIIRYRQIVASLCWTL
jgi:hypothetical protein